MWRAVFGALGLVVWAAAANAQVAEVPRPCAEDARRLCGGVQPGRGRIAECLRARVDEVSDACKLHIEARADEIDFGACRADVRQWCGSVEPGEGRVRACLRQNAALLSATCRVYQRRIRD